MFQTGDFYFSCWCWSWCWCLFIVYWVSDNLALVGGHDLGGYYPIILSTLVPRAMTDSVLPCMYLLLYSLLVRPAVLVIDIRLSYPIVDLCGVGNWNTYNTSSGNRYIAMIFEFGNNFKSCLAHFSFHSIFEFGSFFNSQSFVHCACGVKVCSCRYEHFKFVSIQRIACSVASLARAWLKQKCE